MKKKRTRDPSSRREGVEDGAWSPCEQIAGYLRGVLRHGRFVPDARAAIHEILADDPRLQRAVQKAAPGLLEATFAVAAEVDALPRIWEGAGPARKQRFLDQEPEDVEGVESVAARWDALHKSGVGTKAPRRR